MSTMWYEFLTSDEPLTQGEIVFDCPVIRWKDHDDQTNYQAILNTSDEDGQQSLIEANVKGDRVDAIIMTQSCDLANRNYPYVLLAQHFDIKDFYDTWIEKQKTNIQDNESQMKKAWTRYCDDLRKGRNLRYTVIDRCTRNDSEDEGFNYRIVDFTQLMTVPQALIRLIQTRSRYRRSLASPYREYLSQTFARFFMRVGLPADLPEKYADVVFSPPA